MTAEFHEDFIVTLETVGFGGLTRRRDSSLVDSIWGVIKDGDHGYFPEEVAVTLIAKFLAMGVLRDTNRFHHLHEPLLKAMQQSEVPESVDLGTDFTEFMCDAECQMRSKAPYKLDLPAGGD